MIITPVGFMRSARAGVESNWCVSFDGVDDLISFGSGITVSGEFTFSCWLYTDTSVSSTWSALAATTDGIGVYIRPDTKKLYVQFAAGNFTFDDTNVCLGAWCHIAITRDSSNVIRAYVDGVVSSYTATITGSWLITSISSPFWKLKASRVDDWRFYSRDLSPTEVNALCTNTSPPTTGLTFHLPLEEGTGTTTVDSVGGVTATLVGGATWHPQTPPKLVSGRNTIVRSLSLDGVDDYITMGNPPELAGNVAVTLSAWVKPNSSATLGVVAGKAVNNSSDQEFWIEYGRGSSATFRTVWGGGLVNQSATHPPGVWYHVALVRSGEAGSWTSKLYVDGVEEDSKTITYNPRGNGGFVVGRAGNSNAEYVSASISSVIAFFRALSPTEVQKLCRGQNPTTNNPVGWWKGDETSGTLVEDFGSGGNNGTCVGGVTRSTDVPAWLTT